MEIISIHRIIEAKNILSIKPNKWTRLPKSIDAKMITENMDNSRRYLVISLNSWSILIRIESMRMPKLLPKKIAIAVMP
jgi:hypothetical protein